jgi:hypothetical protein
VHQAGGLPVQAERDAEGRADEEVDPQRLRRRERLTRRDIEQRRAEEREHECHERDQHEADVLREVVVQLAALLDGAHDRGEVAADPRRGLDHRLESVHRAVGLAPLA